MTSWYIHLMEDLAKNIRTVSALNILIHHFIGVVTYTMLVFQRLCSVVFQSTDTESFGRIQDVQIHLYSK